VNQRDALLVLFGVVIAVGIAGLLAIGTVTAPPRGEGRPSFYFGQGRVPQSRPIEFVQRQAPEPIRPIVPFQRGVSDSARDAAGYLLVLLGVSAALVLGREPVLASYHATLGGWRTQARVFGTGLAVVLLIASSTFLLTVLLLSAVSGPPQPGRPGFDSPFALQSLFLQAGLLTVVVAVAFAGIVALIGVAAASWRLGDAILGTRFLSRLGSRVPAPLVAVIGVTLIYLLAAVPAVGPFIALLTVAYALGAVVTARLGHASEHAAALS